MKGLIESKATDADLLTINVGENGSLYIDAASNVAVKAVNFAKNKKVTVGLAGADRSSLVSVYNGEKDAVSGTFEIKEGTLTGVTHDVLKTDSLFFDLAKEDVKVEDKKISVSMKKKEGVTMESFADTENQKKIASAIAASGNALTGDVLTAANEKQVKEILSTLDDDFYATARNALVVNATAVSRTVMDQARGMGEGRSAEVDNGRARIWAAGIGHWGEAEGNLDTMDVDFRAGFLGLLHMDIVQERLEREYNMDLITTAPSVVYEVLQTDGTVVHVENPSKLPPVDKIDEIREPIDTVTIFVPDEYVGAVMKLCQDKRGIQTNLAYHGRQVHLTYELPLAEIVLDFTAALDAATVEANIYLLDAGGAKVDASDVYDGAKRVTLKPSAGLNAYASYRLIVDSGLKSAAGEAILTGKVIRIRTGLDTSDKFPQISDEELLTKVQQQTFRYFWEGAEPTSGMARERTSSGATVSNEAKSSSSSSWQRFSLAM